MELNDKSAAPAQSPLASPALPDAPRRTPSIAGITLPSFLLLLAGFNLIVLSYAVASRSEAYRRVYEKVTAKKVTLDERDIEKRIRANPLAQAEAYAFLIGASSAFAALVAFSSRKHRRRLLSFLRSTTPHPRPALGLFDALAVVSAAWGVTLAFTTAVFMTIDLATPGAGSAVGSCFSDLGWAAAIAAAVALAHWKAGGWDGAYGFWPFWRSYAPDRAPLWSDAALGLCAYLFSSWLVSLSSRLNQLFFKAPDHHPLVDIMATHPTPTQTAVIVFAATFGAAFFEEIIFRGILYNALRRHYRAVPAAIAAALLFSAVHRIAANLLPLFLIGIILTWLYEKTGRLVASMVFHFANNFVSIVTLLAIFHDK